MKEIKEMLPYLIKYYTSNWKEAFLKAVEANWVVSYLSIYWIILPCSGMMDEGITAILIYYGLFLPIVLGGLHSVMFPNRLDKTMFLCPMGYREKKLFLLLGYWFRFSCVCFASIVIIIFMLEIGLLKYSNYLIVFFLCEAMFMAVVFLMTYTEESKKSGSMFWVWAAWIVSMISCLFLGNIVWEYSDEKLEGWERNFVIILFLIQMLLFLNVMITCWKKEMEIAVDYEKNFLFK